MTVEPVNLGFFVRQAEMNLQDSSNARLKVTIVLSYLLSAVSGMLDTIIGNLNPTSGTGGGSSSSNSGVSSPALNNALTMLLQSNLKV
jgi:hypothetical protein